MTVLAADAQRTFAADQDLRLYPVGASVKIYKGGFVGVDPAGYAKVFEPGDKLVGVSYETIDNSSGSAAALNVRVHTQGDLQFTLASAALTDHGKPVFATDDNTIALTGHPDAYVGRILHYMTTNTVLIRLKAPGEMPPNGVGSFEIDQSFVDGFEATGAASSTKYHHSGLIMKSILGLGVSPIAGEDGGVTGVLDATSEIALASIRALNATFPVDKGITFECTFRCSAIGGAAALDVDWGMGTALDTDTEADIDHASMVQLACFHLDGNVANILAQSDDATTDVAPVDTLIDNSLTVNKKFKIVIRKAGTVEFWIDGARVLSGTTFAVLSTVLLAPFINLEKTADTTLGTFILSRLRAAGGKAA